MWAVLTASPKWVTILLWTLIAVLGGGITWAVYAIKNRLAAKYLSDLENENARLRVVVGIQTQIQIGQEKWEKIKQDLNSAADVGTFIELWNKHLEELRKGGDK